MTSIVIVLISARMIVRGYEGKEPRFGARIFIAENAAVIGEVALVGAGALVSEGMRVPPRTLVVGVPARVKRPLADAEIAHLEESWKNYVGYKEAYLKG